MLKKFRLMKLHNYWSMSNERWLFQLSLFKMQKMCSYGILSTVFDPKRLITKWFSLLGKGFL